jgi:hypothetical protein
MSQHYGVPSSDAELSTGPFGPEGPNWQNQTWTDKPALKPSTARLADLQTPLILPTGLRLRTGVQIRVGAATSLEMVYEMATSRPISI